MFPRSLVVIALLAACGTTAQAGADATSATDTNATIVTGTTYAERCQSLATALCARWQSCCTEIPATCVADVNKVCMSPAKFSPLADAAIAGKLVLDPKLSAACDAAVAAVSNNCGSRNSSSVLITCLYAWVDPAEIGQPCVNSAKEVCGGGLGRCTAVSTGIPSAPQPTCTKALAIGETCPANGAECVWGAFCGSAMGQPVCIAEGALCGTSGDVVALCPEGKVCGSAGSCVADPGAGAGAACAADTDCKRDHACTAGKCVPTLCAEMGGK